MTTHSSLSRAEPTSSGPSDTARVEAFSDGVFAIIITLLILDLRVPRASTLGVTGLAGALRAQWPNYFAFVLSFCIVGVVWANHHVMFRLIRRTNQTLIVLNGLLLLCVAILPFTAALLAEYIRGESAEQRLVAQVYSGALVVGGLCFNLVWWYAVRSGLCGSESNERELRRVGQLWVFGPALYAMAFALAWVSPRLSLAIYIALIGWFGISGPWLARRLRKG